MRRYFILLIFVCFCVGSAVAQGDLGIVAKSIDEFVETAKPEEWKTYKNKKGVSLRYRWLHLNEKNKTRQLSLQFKSSKKISDLIKLIKSPDLIRHWNSSIRNQDIFDDDSISWVSHTVFAIPYPLNQQDLVVQNTVSSKNVAVHVDGYAIPDYLESLENTKRQQFYLSQWRFIPEEQDQLNVEFTLVSMSKSAIPRWIRDPIVLNRLVNSFVELKNWNHTEQ